MLNAINRYFIFSDIDSATFKKDLALGSAGADSRVALRTVLESLDSESDRNWFEEVLLLTLRDSKSKLFPWGWRPLF